MDQVFKQGEYALNLIDGKLVKIIGSTESTNMFGMTKTLLKIVALDDIDPFNKSYRNVQECNFKQIAKISQEEVQFLMKMMFEAKKFELIRQIY